MVNIIIFVLSLILLAVNTIQLKKFIGLSAVMHHYVYIFKIGVLFVLTGILLVTSTLFGMLYPMDYLLLPFASATLILLNHSLLKAMERFGNLPNYVVTVYITIVFVLFTYPFSKLLLLLWLTLRFPQWIINITAFLTITLFWYALYSVYRKISLLIPALVGIITLVSHIILNTLSYHLLPVFTAYTVLIYLYVEFIHPYPTLFDKYVFDKPVHRFWQFLLGLTTLIMLLL